MTRLPTPGADDGTWGDILNAFLDVAHNSDGSLKTSAITSAGGVSSVNGKTPSSGSVSLGLSNLNDTGVSSPTNNQVLTYNSTSSKWENQNSASGVTLDTIASDIQPLGTQAAGSTGKAADAGHVHTMPRLDQVSNPTASVSLNSQKITGLANGTASTDAAAFGQIPVAGTTTGTYAAGDDSRITGAIQKSTATAKGDLLAASAAATIDRLGVGTDGQVLTADSTQTTGIKWATAAATDQAWQFRPETYGALGNGQVASDVSTNGTSTFTSATIAANASTGQWVMIDGGRGTADTAAIGTITTISGNNITISSPTLPINATASSLNAIWGTDDTAAINNAVSAAKTYAEANDFFAEVLFSSKMYIVAGLTQSSNGTAIYNTQIPIPYPTNNNGRKLVIGLKGAGRVDHLQYWNTTIPQAAGSCLVSMQAAPNSIDATYGVQSVIGAPTPDTGMAGTISPTFVNHKPVIENLQVVCPVYTNITGFDFTYSCGMYMDGCSAYAFAQPLEGTGVILSNIWSDGTVFGAKQGTGLRLPTAGNNADIYVPSFACEGFNVGISTPSEHTTMGNLKFIYNGVALQVTGSTTGHGLTIQHVTAEAYQGGLQYKTGGSGNMAPVYIASWSTEDSASVYDVYDPGNSFYGEFHWFDMLDGRAPVVNGAGNLKFVNDSVGTGNWPGAPAVPASAAAQQNTSWRDAAVNVSGGTVTDISVDGSSTGLTNGTVVVPAGKNITLTYSSVPSWNWTLL